MIKQLAKIHKYFPSRRAMFERSIGHEKNFDISVFIYLISEFMFWLTLDNDDFFVVFKPTSSSRGERRHVIIIYVAEITFHAHLTFISDNRAEIFYDRPRCTSVVYSQFWCFTGAWWRKNVSIWLIFLLFHSDWESLTVD